MIKLTLEQARIAGAALQAKIFVHGPAGCGKTTAGVERLLSLLTAEVPGESILVIVPQRTLGLPYTEALFASPSYLGGSVSILTVGGLAQRMVELFWPLVGDQAGFAHPGQPPTFLTLETAQYYMAQIIEPLMEQGLFDSVVMDRNRLYSQVIDNLNKAAVVGFPYTEIGARLKSAWMGKPEQAHVYEDAQRCATLFRQFCLANNLLDFSLQLETFLTHLWPDPICRKYLVNTYRHLIVDNIEEDTPAAQDLLLEWIPAFESALVVNDENAGYRRFLGADPENVLSLTAVLPENIYLGHSHVMSPAIQGLQHAMQKKLAPPGNTPQPLASEEGADQDWNGVLSFGAHNYFPAMLDWITDQIAQLVTKGTPPGEIAVLAPFVSDALRFSLAQRLETLGIASRTHRPSRSLHDEPVTHCLFTLSMLAHPQWFSGLGQSAAPTRFDLAYALVQAIEGLDLVRAQLLSEIVNRKSEGLPTLGSFDRINPDMQERITYYFGAKYEALRLWLEAYRKEPPQELDHFLGRLFGEVLSQPGYGFHNHYLNGEICANLIELIQKFRWVAAPAMESSKRPLGLEYIQMVQEGVIAAQYIRSWQIHPEDAVWIAPAYTFLMANRPVDYQFWLDAGSRSWAERLFQPLTHPYVLSRSWPEGRTWTDQDEVSTSQDALYRLATGLLRRCRSGLFLGVSKLGEQGYEQRGPLLVAIQSVLRANLARQ